MQPKIIWRRKRPIIASKQMNLYSDWLMRYCTAGEQTGKKPGVERHWVFWKRHAEKQESISLIIKWHVVPSIWLGKHHFSKMMEAIFGNIHCKISSISKETFYVRCFPFIKGYGTFFLSSFPGPEYNGLQSVSAPLKIFLSLKLRPQTKYNIPLA